jgi:hypothetical protein
MAPDDETRYYVGWVHSTFPNAVVVWIIGGGSGGSLAVELIKEHANAVIFSKSQLMASSPKNMVCGHGCGGPLLRVQAKMVKELCNVALAHLRGNQNLPPKE